jgi:hypothetical protein
MQEAPGGPEVKHGGTGAGRRATGIQQGGRHRKPLQLQVQCPGAGFPNPNKSQFYSRGCASPRVILPIIEPGTVVTDPHMYIIQNVGINTVRGQEGPWALESTPP